MSNQYKPYVDARFASIWRQVAERFKSYDDHLLFESVNEPTDGKSVNEINGYEQRILNAVTRVNELNALFVKTVRATSIRRNFRLWNTMKSDKIIKS